MSACAADADACCSTFATSIKELLIECPFFLLLTFTKPTGNTPRTCLSVNELCFLGYGCDGFRFGLAGGISEAVVFPPVDMLDILFTVAGLSPLAAKLLNNSALSSSFVFPVTSLLLFFPINA